MKKTFEYEKEYTEALHALHFSKEAKERMAEKLIKEKTTGNTTKRKRRTHRLPKLAVAGLAAALVLFVSASAYGIMDAGEALRGVFGPTADTKIIDKIGRPIGASDTDNGVTITADAIMCDGYNFAITYSIAKEDGTAFDIAQVDGSGGLLDVFFGMENTNFGTFSGSHGSSYFYDADPGDHTIQYVEKWSYDEPVKPGKTVSVTFTDLKTSSDTGDNSESFRTIAQGTWNLKFEMNFETLSAQLPSGQSFELNGMDGIINFVMVSPLGYRFEYTLNDKARFDEAPNGKSPDQHEQEWTKFDVPRSLNLSDGTVYDLSEGGGSIDTSGHKTVCIRSGVFDKIIPFEKMVSINISGVDIPVQ